MTFLEIFQMELILIKQVGDAGHIANHVNRALQKRLNLFGISLELLSALKCSLY